MIEYNGYELDEPELVIGIDPAAKGGDISVWTLHSTCDHNVLQLASKHNHKGYKMKHKITVLVSVLAILGVLGASFVSYEHYRNWRDAQTVKAHVSAVYHAQLVAAEQRQHDAKINGLKAQCTKDHAAYLALTPAQKAKSVGLDCDPSLELVQ